MRKGLLLAIRIIFGLSLIGWLIAKVGIQELIGAFSSVPVIVVVAIIISFLVTNLIGAYNIQILADHVKHIPFSRTLRYFLLSWAIGLVGLGKIGEFSILLFLKKNESYTYGQALAVSLLDKVNTLFSLLIISSFLAVYILPGTNLIHVIIFLFVALCGLVIAVLSPRIRTLVRKFILRKHSKHLDKFGSTFTSLVKNAWGRIAVNLLLTIVKWGITAWATYFGLVMLGAQAPFFITFIVVCASTLVSVIPVSISGLGVREMTFVGLLAAFGVSQDLSLTVSLLFAVLGYAFAFLISVTVSGSRKDKKSVRR
ncbi:MAG: lysylphosphatidylglycerol synthase transmembrane domain-containing protein [archaeon]